MAYTLSLQDVCQDGDATSWMSDRIFVCSLSDIAADPKDFADSVCNLPYIYNHVGGHGTNSPQRGVCVIGNQELGTKSKPVNHTYWTSTQQTSPITLSTQTVPLPDSIANIIPDLKKLTSCYFPDTPITAATYCLGVANEYRVGYKDTIAAHTDAQPWYASPPIFVSITFYPDGQPADPKACYRFQIYDESTNKWRFVHLPHGSVCIMRADVLHRVQPPLASALRKHKPKRRINITLRNLVCSSTNPLGFVMALSNHYRYYGVPHSLIIPKDMDECNYKSLIDRYISLSSDILIVKDKRTRQERLQLHRSCRTKLKSLYSKNNLDSLDITEIISKPNVVLEATQLAFTFID